MFGKITMQQLNLQEANEDEYCIKPVEQVFHKERKVLQVQIRI